MGRSVQLLVVTLRPGSERGAGAGLWLGCWKGTAGDAVDGKGCAGPPAAPVAGTGVGRGRQAGLGMRAPLRTLAAGRGCSLELAARQGRPWPGALVSPEGPGGGTGLGREGWAQLSAVLQPKRVKRDDWRSVILPLARSTEDKNTAAAPTP